MMANIECWLKISLIFQGIRSIIVMKPYSFVFLKGSGPPCTPSGSAHDARLNRLQFLILHIFYDLTQNRTNTCIHYTSCDCIASVGLPISSSSSSSSICADPEDKGLGVWTPLINHKNIGFLSNTGSDPLKNHKTSKPAFNVGHHQPASETPFNETAI